MPNELPTVVKALNPTSGFPPGDPTKGLGIPKESDLAGQWDLTTRLPQDWGNQGLQSCRSQTKQNKTKTQRKGAMTPQETEPKLPASVGGPPVEARIGRSTPQGWGHWKQGLGRFPLG